MPLILLIEIVRLKGQLQEVLTLRDMDQEGQVTMDFQMDNQEGGPGGTIETDHHKEKGADMKKNFAIIDPQGNG